MDNLTLIATTVFGMEAVVARELEAMGYRGLFVQDGKVIFTGGVADIARTNLWLRSADRVLVRMGFFEAKDFDALFEQTKALPWEDFLSIDSRFPVSGNSVRSQLHSTPHCQSVVKKAIVERLKKSYQRHWFEETGTQYQIDVTITNDQATLSIDTSGPGLHKRGYRDKQGPAPIKETLAAGLLQLSYWNAGRPFLDPFCGSGTIPIEAAMIGCNIAPGLNRSFDAEDWVQIPRKIWKEARTEALDSRKKSMGFPAVGSDRDWKMVAMSEHHAKQAGVAANVQFHKRDFEDIEIEQEYGCIVTNPPYGERLGEMAEVEELYREMGRRLSGMETWSIYVFTAHKYFERLFGRPADRRRKLYNGTIECHYYQYYGKRPPKSDESEGATSHGSSSSEA